jgi:hypothetical protein
MLASHPLAKCQWFSSYYNYDLDFSLFWNFFFEDLGVYYYFFTKICDPIYIYHELPNAIRQRRDFSLSKNFFLKVYEVNWKEVLLK